MKRRPGFATFAVLHALAAGTNYGLDIMAATGLPSGTVYPILARLERDGLLRARWESTAAATAEGRPRRRYYALTKRGASVVQEEVARWRTLADLVPRAPQLGEA